MSIQAPTELIKGNLVGKLPIYRIFVHQDNKVAESRVAESSVAESGRSIWRDCGRYSRSTKCLVFSIQNASRFERFLTSAKGRLGACRFHGRIIFLLATAFDGFFDQILNLHFLRKSYKIHAVSLLLRRFLS